jgi:regulator of RNase E activity RraA
VTTCDLSDACDALGVAAASTGSIKPVWGCAPICGPLVTLKLSPSGKTEIVIGTLVPIMAAVVDGCVRDLQGIEELKFPAYARGTVVHSVRGRVGIEAINEPVSLGGRHVAPGWIAAADRNGVIAFPADVAPEVIRAARRAVEIEKDIFSRIRAGADPVKLHEDLKYTSSMEEQLATPASSSRRGHQPA